MLVLDLVVVLGSFQQPRTRTTTRTIFKDAVQVPLIFLLLVQIRTSYFFILHLYFTFNLCLTYVGAFYEVSN